jgi:hypothetical protein
MIHKPLRLVEKLKDIWCRAFHNEPMWPVNGRYQCRCCLRYHGISWTVPTL